MPELPRPGSIFVWIVTGLVDSDEGTVPPPPLLFILVGSSGLGDLGVVPLEPLGVEEETDEVSALLLPLLLSVAVDLSVVLDLGVELDLGVVLAEVTPAAIADDDAGSLHKTEVDTKELFSYCKHCTCFTIDSISKLIGSSGGRCEKPYHRKCMSAI